MYLQCVLIVLLVLLIFSLYRSSGGSIVLVTPRTPPTVTVAAATKPNAENLATQENLEYFTNGAQPECDPDDPLTFAKYEWGRKGSTYVDFVRDVGIDDEIRRRQTQFVEERNPKYLRSNGATNPAFPDNDLEGESIPWTGLRKPRNVPIYNPDQLLDVNTTQYSDHDTISWKGY